MTISRACAPLLFSLPVLASALPLAAQEYRGTIQGNIVDNKGYSIPKAHIEARSAEQDYKSDSNGDGYFNIPFVQPGTYTVTVTAPGFGTYTRSGLILDITQKINLPVKLTAGGVSETVTISSEAVPLATTDASGGTVMDPEKVQNLPLNGRQVYTMLALTPGVKFTQTQFGAGGYSGTRGWDTSNAYSINGQPGSYNQFLLNGAPISVQGGGGAGTWNISPTIDAVQEFKVMTITFDAQYGRVGGGAVNTIIKNGTPHFHGTAYEFWRNSALEANTFEASQLDEPKAFHNQHQFGGTVGGPFLKHNAFFFFSYEGWREVLPAPVVTSVPTADMLPAGPGSPVDLSAYLAATGRTGGIYDPLTTTCAQHDTSGGCSTHTRQQFAGNVIPGARINPTGVDILKLFPAPNRPGYTNNFVFNGKDRYSYNMPIARVDYSFTDRTRLYGVFAWWSGHEYRNGNGFSGPAITGDINNYRSSLTQVLDFTHVFSDKIVGDVRASFNRYYYEDPSGSVAAGLNTLTPGDLGLQMPHIPTTARNWAPAFSFGDGYEGVVGNQADPSIFETYDIGPSVTQTLKQHNLHYGAEVSLYHDVAGGIGNANGNFYFGDAFTQQNPFQGNNDGSTIAQTLLGYAGDPSNSGGVQYSYAPYESYNYFGFFVQDDWKVSEHWAINAGLRWDEELSPRERHNRLLAGMDFNAVNPISNLINYPANNTLPNGATIANPIRGSALFASNSLPAYPNNTGYWQPKFGLNYSPNSKLVFHGGYTLSKALGIELGGASTFSQTTNYNYTPDNGLTPTPFFAQGNPFPNGFITPPGRSQGALSLVGTGFGIDLRDRKIPIVQQWTFGFETQLPAGIVANLAYLGSHATRLRASRQLNGLSPADFAKGTADPNYLDQQVPNPFFGILPNTVSLGQNPTVQARYLMVPYPQFDGNLYDYTYPGGYDNYNALLAKLEKRITGAGGLSKGLSFLSSFTWSKLMSATGYLNNNGASLVDAQPFYGIDPTDRPWDFALSGLYGLPFGRGAAFLANSNTLVAEAVSDWQLDWIFTNDGGTPVQFPNNNIYNCGGSYSIRSTHRTYSSYLNNSSSNCFTTFPEYTAVTHAGYTTEVRNPFAQQTAIGLEKRFIITEGTRLQFKAEVFNITNTPIFGSPGTTNPQTAITRNTSVANPNQPGAFSGYGTIGSTQQNFPRQMQLSLKYLF